MTHEHHYIIDAGINGDTLREFCAWLENRSGNILLGITSSGGSKTYGSYLLRVLNENKHRITLQALGGVYSAAFDVFYFYEGPKALVRGESKGMTHYGYQTIEINEANKVVYHEGICAVVNLKYNLTRSLEVASKIMTPQELRKFKKGDDVYFSFERMVQIFPNAEII
jgi:hypothetical protein